MPRQLRARQRVLVGVGLCRCEASRKHRHAGGLQSTFNDGPFRIGEPFLPCRPCVLLLGDCRSALQGRYPTREVIVAHLETEVDGGVARIQQTCNRESGKQAMGQLVSARLTSGGDRLTIKVHWSDITKHCRKRDAKKDGEITVLQPT